MKAISIYTITRNQNTEYLQKLERQLSRAGCVSENTGMGAGQHESAGFGVGETYTGGVRTAFFLFLSDSETGKMSLICFRSRKNKF